jgi:uncharacterized protein (TIGR00369 family)
MKKPNPKHIETLCEMINTSPYPELLSMKIADIGTGYAKIEVGIEEKHTQLLGVVHGGMLASLIDTVAFWSVYYEIEDPDAWLTSVDLKVNYLAPAISGKLIALGKQIKAGRNLCYAEAEVRNENGEILTRGASTLMVIRGRKLTRHVDFPPKFIDS